MSGPWRHRPHCGAWQGLGQAGLCGPAVNPTPVVSLPCRSLPSSMFRESGIPGCRTLGQQWLSGGLRGMGLPAAEVRRVACSHLPHLSACPSLLACPSLAILFSPFSLASSPRGYFLMASFQCSGLTVSFGQVVSFDQGPQGVRSHFPGWRGLSHLLLGPGVCAVALPEA